MLSLRPPFHRFHREPIFRFLFSSDLNERQSDIIYDRHLLKANVAKSIKRIKKVVQEKYISCNFRNELQSSPKIREFRRNLEDSRPQPNSDFT